MQNGLVELFIGRLRDECLNEHLFTSYAHARSIIGAWRADYNNHRPHSSLDGLTPKKFATRSSMDHYQNRLSLLTRTNWGAGHSLMSVFLLRTVPAFLKQLLQRTQRVCPIKIRPARPTERTSR